VKISSLIHKNLAGEEGKKSAHNKQAVVKDEDVCKSSSVAGSQSQDPWL